MIVGVRLDGSREILGLKVVDRESEGFWPSIIDELKARGLKNVKLIIPDSHKGIRKAVIQAFSGAS
jgi:transposase-like protein